MIAIVIGTRPEIIKVAPLVWALQASSHPFMVLDTAQHTLPEMSASVYDEMGYQPSWRLPVYSFGKAVDEVAKQLAGAQAVVVQGDTWTALAGALAGLQAGVPVVHLESGLRSWDPDMVEERNRMMVDDVAALLLTYVDAHSRYLTELQRNGWSGLGRVVQVGNPAVDVIHRFRDRIDRPVLDLEQIDRGRYAYVTLHRQELTSHPDRLERVLTAVALGLEQNGLSAVFPVHPRTTDRLRRSHFELHPTLWAGVVSPVSALTSLGLIRHAAVVVTDSGGVQEEAALLGVRCVTVRENTERPETLVDGRNCLTGFEPSQIASVIAIAAASPRPSPILAYGTPGVGRRILHACEELYEAAQQTR